MRLSMVAASCAAALAQPAPPVASNAGGARHVRAILCDTAAHAIQLADVRAGGGSDELARDRIGRMAGAEVCGLYAGIATILSRSVSIKGGIAYEVTAYRFSEDQRIAWRAERGFAPSEPEWDL